MGLSPGDQVDRYVLEKQLGEGGQGEVWRATDPLAEDWPRAIKLVRVESTGTSKLERIRREARQLVQLRHPSIVECFGMFEDLHRELLGIVMEFVDAQSLDELLDNGRFDDKTRLYVLAHVAHALAYVHQRNIVHRDVKLENVLVTRGFWETPDDPEMVKLIDFGIAAKETNPNPLTQVGHIIGTPAYLAPELLEPVHWGGSAAAAAPADVFAFGILAWKLFARSADAHPTLLPPRSRIDEYASAYRRAPDEHWPGTLPNSAQPWNEFFRRVLARHVRDRPKNGLELVQLLATLSPDVLLRTADETAPTPMFGSAAASQRKSTPRRTEPETVDTSETPRAAVQTVPGEPPILSAGSDTRPATPAGMPLRRSQWSWVALAVVGAGSFMVIAITLGALFIFGLTDGGSSASSPASPSSPAAPGTPRSAGKQPLSRIEKCSGCDYVGTVCEAGRCRLAPGSRWNVRPFALRRGSVNAPEAYQSFELCLRRAGTHGWTCSEPKNTFVTKPSGDAVYYFSKESPPVVLTREQIEQEGIDIQVTLDGDVVSSETGKRPRDNSLIAGDRLFRGGLTFEITGRYVKEAFFALELSGAE